jgi:hypothetical protein
VHFSSFADFEDWFIGQYDAITIEEGATQRGPFYAPTVDPNEPPWQSEWIIEFSNGKYVRAVETYYRRKQRDGGGGTRTHFSFHYGDTPASDPSGNLMWNNTSQLDIRIDRCSRKGSHIHFAGEDHIPQARVTGMAIDSQDSFTFVNAIQQHRRTGRTLKDVFGFTVEQAA